MKPKVNSQSEQELQKAEEQFQAFDDSVKQMTMDRMNEAPKQDVEQLHKLSQKEIEKMGDIWLKPSRSLGPGADPKTNFKETFNERFRKDWEFAKEYVRFIAEHREMPGETIECWTKPFPGVNCEFWQIPTGRPVWGPRHLAEQLSKCKYHRLVMKQNTVGGDQMGNQYYGQMAVDTTIQRLDAVPVSPRKSIFMGMDDFSYDGRKVI